MNVATFGPFPDTDQGLRDAFNTYHERLLAEAAKGAVHHHVFYDETTSMMKVESYYPGEEVPGEGVLKDVSHTGEQSEAPPEVPHHGSARNVSRRRRSATR